MDLEEGFERGELLLSTEGMHHEKFGAPSTHLNPSVLGVFKCSSSSQSPESSSESSVSSLIVTSSLSIPKTLSSSKASLSETDL